MYNWKKALIKINSKISDVVENLNNSAFQIALIVDKKNEFIGTITDGDIRRAFLKGARLNDNIKDIINQKPIILNNKTPKYEAFNIMRKKEIRHIPIIDKKKILGIHFLNEKEKKNKSINAEFVIIAGGKGERLMPLTQKTPKPMLKIKNKPILEHIILKAKKEGFKKFTIIVHHLREKIINYFEDGRHFGVKIKYIVEKIPLGTAGGLGLIKNNISKNFIVSNSDVITDLKYNEILNFHNQYKSSVTMAVKVIDKKEKFGLVKLNGLNIRGFEEKPMTTRYINCGVYVFNKKIINNLSSKKNIDMISFLKLIKKKKKKIIAFPIYENWSDLGLKKQLVKFNK